MISTNAHLAHEIFCPVFAQITVGRDFAALSQTCRRLNEMSRSNFVIANCSLPSRQHLLRRAIRSNPTLINIACDKKKSPENNFYLVFKKACLNLNIDTNSKDFSDCAFDVSTLCTGFCNSMWQHVYTDMLAAFADQPIETITEYSLNEKMKDLYTFSGQKSLVAVEREVRTCLKLKKGNLFLEFAKQLQSDHTERISRIKKRITNELEMEKEIIFDELRILDGPAYLYGSVKASKNLLSYASARRVSAVNAFMDVSWLPSPYCLNTEEFKLVPPGVQATYRELATANDLFYQAKESFLKISARYNSLIMRDGLGHVVGGKLYHVEKRLAYVDETAFNEFTLRVRFYFELNREVSDSNEKFRHKALRRIISADPEVLSF